jgi:hypothetical protein
MYRLCNTVRHQNGRIGKACYSTVSKARRALFPMPSKHPAFPNFVTQPKPGTASGLRPAPPPVYKHVHTVIAQAKSANSPVSRRNAPPVYRPDNTTAVQSKPATTAGPRSAAPPVYRPTQAHIAQPKLATTSGIRLAAPPVYRPIQAVIAQPKPATPSGSRPSAPPLYRPGDTAVAQQKPASRGPHASVPRLRSNVLQPKWMFIYEGKSASFDSVYWDDPMTPQPTVLPPVAVANKVSLTVMANAFGKVTMTEDQYIGLRGKPSAPANKMNHYNPFGRFNTNTTKTAYLVHGGGELAASEISSSYAESHHTIAEYEPALSFWGQPKWVKFTGDPTEYNVIAADPFGLTYGTGPTVHPSGIPPRVEKLRRPTGLSPKTKPFWDEETINAFAGSITKTTINSMPKRKTEPDQKIVMGISAEEMANAAGYGDAIDPEFPNDAKKHGWQWLHLLSYALGGDEKRGAQNSNNLVVGTTQANTQMIIIEDAINGCIMQNLVRSVWVSVTAKMASAMYRVAETIQYVIVFTLNNGMEMAPIDFHFSALTTMTPYVATNVYVRGVLRAKIDAAEKSNTTTTNPDVEMTYM